MPLYPYVCDKCGYEEEKLVSFSDPNTLKCPKCGSKTLKRKLGVPFGKVI